MDEIARPEPVPDKGQGRRPMYRGSDVRSYRALHGVSQAVLATSLGVTREAVVMSERREYIDVSTGDRYMKHVDDIARSRVKVRNDELRRLATIRGERDTEER